MRQVLLGGRGEITISNFSSLADFHLFGGLTNGALRCMEQGGGAGGLIHSLRGRKGRGAAILMMSGEQRLSVSDKPVQGSLKTSWIPALRPSVRPAEIHGV